jgi:hypothetical protein
MIEMHEEYFYQKMGIKWKLSHNTDWDSFQEFLCDQFKSWNTHNFNGNIEVIWNDWLTKVTMAAESTIRKRKRSTKLRSFWDKELNALIKSHHLANHLKRILKQLHFTILFFHLNCVLNEQFPFLIRFSKM